MQDQATHYFWLFLKGVTLLFTLAHVAIGFILFRQITRMKKVIKTKARGCIVFFSLIHIVILLFVLILVLFLPT